MEADTIYLPLAASRYHWPQFRAVVTYVVDGDTIEVSFHDIPLRVRYIGIDTPEMWGSECYAREAKAANEQLVLGREVSLVPDLDMLGPYNRQLFYVYVDGICVNQQLVSEGYALVSIYLPNDALVSDLVKSELQATTANRGLWGYCVPPKPPEVPSNSPLRITHVRYASADEYVRITNLDSSDHCLSGWQVVSVTEGQRYTFGDVVLESGYSVYLHSGADPATSYDERHIVWWNRYVWNNDGDTAHLLAPDSASMDAWSYPYCPDGCQSTRH